MKSRTRRTELGHLGAATDTLTPLVDVAPAAAPPAAGTLRGDLAGGVVAALLAIPQCIVMGALAFAPLGPGYATIGMVAGFYSAIIGTAALAFARDLPFQVGGPHAAVSVVFASLLAAVLTDSQISTPLGALGIAFLLCFLGAGVQALLGLLRAGDLVKYVPYPVTAGFMNGIALIILASQLPAALGLPAGAGLSSLPSSLAEVRPPTVLVSLVTMIAIFVTPRVASRAPASLVGLVAGTAAFYGIEALAGAGSAGHTVGVLPSGLPGPSELAGLIHVPRDTDLLRTIAALMPYAVVLALVGSLASLMTWAGLESVSATRSDANRGLLAEGTGNMIAAGLGGLFSSASITRSMACYVGGGRGRAAAAVYGGLLFALVIGAGAWARYLPMPVLAAVMIAGSVHALDDWTRALLQERARRSLKSPETRMSLLVVGLVTFTALALNVVVAVLAGFFATLVFFVRRVSRSIVRSHWRGDARHSQRLRRPEMMEALDVHGREILVIETQGLLFFGTADRLAREVETLAAGARHVILDLKRVTDIDATGARLLHRLGRNLARGGASLALAVPPSGTRALLADLAPAGGASALKWFDDVDAALERAEDEVLAAACPSAAPRGRLPLDHMKLTEGFSVEEMAALGRHFREESFPAGSHLFREGDEGTHLYLLAEGTVSIRQRVAGSPHGLRLAKFSPGVVVGEMALLEGKRRSADAIADEDCVAYRLARSDIEVLEKSHPKVAYKLLMNLSRNLAGRLRSTTVQLRSAQE